MKQKYLAEIQEGLDTYYDKKIWKPIREREAWAAADEAMEKMWEEEREQKRQTVKTYLEKNGIPRNCKVCTASESTCLSELSLGGCEYTGLRLRESFDDEAENKIWKVIKTETPWDKIKPLMIMH